MTRETVPVQGSFITRSAKELEIPGEELDRIIDVALAEDTGHGDITTRALIPPGFTCQASLLVKRAGVLAGTEVFKKVFDSVFTEQKKEVAEQLEKTGQLPNSLDDEKTAKQFQPAIELVYHSAFEDAI